MSMRRRKATYFGRPGGGVGHVAVVVADSLAGTVPGECDRTTREGEGYAAVAGDSWRSVITRNVAVSERCCVRVILRTEGAG